MATTNRFQTRPVTKPAYGYGYGLLFVILNVLLTAFFWWQLPPQIPLFYSVSYGNSQLADKAWFFILPAAAAVIWISYFLLSKVETNSTIYIQILKWLQYTSLFLITLALVHTVLMAL